MACEEFAGRAEAEHKSNDNVMRCTIFDVAKFGLQMRLMIATANVGNACIHMDICIFSAIFMYIYIFVMNIGAQLDATTGHVWIMDGQRPQRGFSGDVCECMTH